MADCDEEWTAIMTALDNRERAWLARWETTVRDDSFEAVASVPMPDVTRRYFEGLREGYIMARREEGKGHDG